MKARHVPWLKIAVVLAAIAGVAAALRFLPVAVWLKHFQDYVQGLGMAGYILYIVVYAVCCVAFVPASVLTLGAGLIFGVVGGSIVVIIGATLGSTAAFLLARTVMRHRIEALTANNAKFRALDRAISREGAKIVLLVRMAVIFPFTYSNYAFGLTGVALGPYVAATFLGIIPGTVAFVYIGAAAATAATTASKVKIAVYVVGGAIALAVSIFVGRIATKAIRRAGIDDEPADDTAV